MTRPIHFLHIAKTGGITIWNLIRDNYEKVFLNPSPLTFRENYKKEGYKAGITIGHTEYSLVRHILPPDTRYITFLRDPLSWLISYYNFQNVDENSPDRDAALQLSFEDFYLSDKVPFRDNFQTQMLLTDGFGVDPVTDAHFEDAKKNLTDKVELMGLTEAFDDTILLLQRFFGWKNILYREENVTEYLNMSPDVKARLVKKRDLSQDLVDRLLVKNKYDVRLYAYACELMENQKEAYGPSFETDLETYRAFNAQFQRRMDQLAAHLKGQNADEIERLKAHIHQNADEIERLKAHIQLMENSRSFRLGKMMLTPAREVARFLRWRQ